MTRTFPQRLVRCLITILVFGIGINWSYPPSTNTSAQDSLAKLNETLASLIQQNEEFSNWGKSKFQNAKKFEEAQSAIDDIIRTLDYISKEMQAEKLIKTPEVVSQLNAEAELMLLILVESRRSSKRISDDAQDRIQKINADLTLKMSSINELKGVDPSKQSYNRGIVKVKTVNKKGAEERQLTIYYVPQALFGTRLQDANTQSFGSLSPSEESLLEADYSVWAGKADEKTPLTNVKDCEARKLSPKDLTLILK